jgi:FkbM family methyltransferase
MSRNRLANIWLRSRWLEPIRVIPVLGPLLRRLSWKLLPGDSFVWLQVKSGPGTGLYLNLNPRFEQAYIAGEHEPIVQRVLAERVRKGDVVYDVGAHIGFLTLIALRNVGDSGLVYAFEADADNVKALKANLRRNSLESRARIVEAAVWSKPGKVEFARKADTPSFHYDGMVAQLAGDDNVSTPTSVAAVSLDSFAQDHEPPSLIKLDVEGGEGAVLRGARKTLRAHRPIVLAEIHDDQSLREVRELLTELGYSLVELAREGDGRVRLLAEATP